MRRESGPNRIEKTIWLGEPIIVTALSLAIVAMIARHAIEASDPADRAAAWIVVAVMLPTLYLLWRLEYRRFRRRFRD